MGSQIHTLDAHDNLLSTHPWTEGLMREHVPDGFMANRVRHGTIRSNVNDGIQEIQQAILYSTGRPSLRLRGAPGVLEYNGLPLRDVLYGHCDTKCMLHLNVVAFPGVSMPSKIGVVYQVSS